MNKLILTKPNDMFEDWYETIKHCTPESIILPLTKEEEIILRAISYDSFEKRGYYMDCVKERPNMFTINEEKVIIENLKVKINNILKGEKKFFRANVFSPKDTGNCICSNADEVLEDYSLSERMFFKAPKLMEGKAMSFVFRELISIKEEYRVFINNGKIIGISQYEDSDVIRKGDIVENVYQIDLENLIGIKTWVDEIIKMTGVYTAVVDISILTDNSYCIVEINPFNQVTDKCLLLNYDIYNNPGATLTVAYATSKSEVKILELDINKIGEVVSENVIKLNEKQINLTDKPIKLNLKDFIKKVNQ